MIGVIETILGLLLFNISVKSLKKSVIRRWKECFFITLFVSGVLVIHGLLSIIVNIPDNVQNILFFAIISIMMVALFRLSDMKGLTA